MKKLTTDEVLSLANALAIKIARHIPAKQNEKRLLFGIPRGGVSAVLAVLGCSIGRESDFAVTGNPAIADVFVDDIIDSGKTMQKWCDNYPGKPFFALVDKTDPHSAAKDEWIAFPWEQDEGGGTGIEDNIIRLLQYIGEDPKRGGLVETPHRVAKAWKDWSAGYGVDIPKLLKTFEDGADGCNEMVVVKDIPFYTHCEHHMAPFFGTATVAYIPNGKIVGLSKLSRVVDAFARRLQVQERLTNQIADAIHHNLDPIGVGVVVKARHLCMESRGVKQQGSVTVTSALRGVMREHAARAEFLALAAK